MKNLIMTLTFFLASFTLFAQSEDSAKVNKPDTTRLLAVDTTIYEKPDVPASFPGGIQAWNKFLEKHLNPTVPVDNGAKPGSYTVTIKFIVSANGTLSDFKAVTKHGHGMEDEVIRILKLSPPWIPAQHNAVNANSYASQTVYFVVL